MTDTVLVRDPWQDYEALCRLLGREAAPRDDLGATARENIVVIYEGQQVTE